MQQSGQESLREIYKSTNILERQGSKISGQWIAASSDSELQSAAKAAAREATEQGRQVTGEQLQAKAVIITRLRAQQKHQGRIPEKVGRFSKEVDKALPGNHTKALYNALAHEEATHLVQLRTGMARLNEYLFRIRAVESDQCECGAAKETVRHFLFRCTKWDSLRRKWEPENRSKRGNLAWALGGKEASDTERWKPNVEAVRRTVRFAIETGRLQARPEETTV